MGQGRLPLVESLQARMEKSEGAGLIAQHFSWYFVPELSCWACCVAVITSSDL